MRKIIVMLVVALIALVSAIAAPQAQAQTYPDVSKTTAFTPEANYMSVPGYLRWQYLLSAGRWISREQAVEQTKQQGGNTGPAPVGAAQ